MLLTMGYMLKLSSLNPATRRKSMPNDDHLDMPSSKRNPHQRETLHFVTEEKLQQILNDHKKSKNYQKVVLPILSIIITWAAVFFPTLTLLEKQVDAKFKVNSATLANDISAKLNNRFDNVTNGLEQFSADIASIKSNQASIQGTVKSLDDRVYNLSKDVTSNAASIGILLKKWKDLSSVIDSTDFDKLAKVLPKNWYKKHDDVTLDKKIKAIWGFGFVPYGNFKEDIIANAALTNVALLKSKKQIMEYLVKNYPSLNYKATQNNIKFGDIKLEDDGLHIASRLNFSDIITHKEDVRAEVP